MIVSQTPLRVSFAGGGSDLPVFYREEFGAVFSVTLRRHVYVTVHERFEPNIRISCMRSETVDSVDRVEHELVRESLRATGTGAPLEITTIADVPAGTGLGSSSTLTVGLLHALHAYAGRSVAAPQLAREACDVELWRLEHPIGKQDQYAAAFGGFNYLRFDPDESVRVDPIACSTAVRNELERHALLVYTQIRRNASELLERQRNGTNERRSVLREMRDLAGELRDNLASGLKLVEFGRRLHEGWQLKRSLGFGISNPEIDAYYDAARAAGAWGGKLLGAGGGGFLLLLAPPERHRAIEERLGRPRTLPFEVETQGSRIVFASP